jgi:hypothetical protein
MPLVQTRDRQKQRMFEHCLAQEMMTIFQQKVPSPTENWSSRRLQIIAASKNNPAQPRVK